MPSYQPTQQELDNRVVRGESSLKIHLMDHLESEAREGQVYRTEPGSFWFRALDGQCYKVSVTSLANQVYSMYAEETS